MLCFQNSELVVFNYKEVVDTNLRNLNEFKEIKKFSPSNIMSKIQLQEAEFVGTHLVEATDLSPLLITTKQFSNPNNYPISDIYDFNSC